MISVCAVDIVGIHLGSVFADYATVLVLALLRARHYGEGRGREQSHQVAGVQKRKLLFREYAKLLGLLIFSWVFTYLVILKLTKIVGKYC